MGGWGGGGSEGETDSVGIRRNPYGPTLCSGIVGNQWNFRILD